MPDDISVQLLSQTSDNIQKLFDLSTRIDERVKVIQSKQQGLEDRIENVIVSYTMIMQKIAVLESKDGNNSLGKQVDECEKEIKQFERRLASIEASTGQSQDRWNKVFTFVIQLVWVVLAAWLLMKLNLQPPAVP